MLSVRRTSKKKKKIILDGGGGEPLKITSYIQYKYKLFDHNSNSSTSCDNMAAFDEFTTKTRC